MSLNQRVLIFGISGQIGQYLAQQLLNRGCEVHGVSRSYQELDARIHYHQLNFTDHPQVSMLIETVKPDEIYNLISPTNINETIKDPMTTYQVNIDSVAHLCQVVNSMGSKIKLFNAGSVEMYRGHVTDHQLEFSFDDTNDNFYPISPYGISKVSAYWIIRYYREQYHQPFYNGILCNVVSPKLNEKYLLPKIIKHVKYHIEQVLQLGNLDIAKDFSHASDIIDGMILAVQSLPASDYVIASGQSHTLRVLVEWIYQERGIRIQWESVTETRSSVADKGYDTVNHRLLVESVPQLQRSYEKKNERMVGMSHKLKLAGWHPQYSLRTMIHEMYKVI